MKNKIISLIIVIMLLLLPFGVLLNVKATGLSFSLDNNTTNGQGKKVLNQASVVVNYIGESDVMAMYKILDVYYDSSSNQTSYGFTSNFSTFASAQNPAITVNDYMTYGTANSPNYQGSAGYSDSSDFNAKISLYAQYVKANNISATYSMTTAHNTTNGNDFYYASRTNVEAGVYLILPSSTATYQGSDNGLAYKGMGLYSVLIANVVPSIDSNGDWQLADAEVNAKAGASSLSNMFAEIDTDGFYAGYGEPATYNYGTSLNYIAGEDYMGLIANFPRYLPANAHTNIQTLINNNVLNMVDIIYPTAVVPDLTDNLYCYAGPDLWAASITNNEYHITLPQAGDLDYADVTETTGKITFEYGGELDGFFSIVYNYNINAAALSNAAGGNTITVVSYMVKDPYVDVGTNITKSDIRAAFDTNDANYSSTKSVNIRRAIEKVEQTSTLYATGVTVNNTNSSSNALAGGEFAVYGSYDSSTGIYSNQLGSNIVMDSNGTGLLNGLDPTQTYYLKQVKAPSGYRLYDDKIIVLPGSSDNTQYDSSTYQVVSVSNGMYTANVVNSPVLALPFTGGSGTVIYTAIGLLIVVGAGIFLVIYKKKNKKGDEDSKKE